MKNIIFFIIACVAGATLHANTPPAHIHNVYVGVYLNDITNFDAKEGRFIGDIYVWFKWGGDSSQVPRVQFSNAEIDNMEIVHKEYDHGWNSVKYRIQASFRGIFPLQDFPFDKQTLRIGFSLDETLGELHPDLAGSGMNEKFSITGWNYQPFFQASVNEMNHYSDFGSIEFEGKPSHVRNIEFFVNISRPKLAPIFKFILPLLIIVIITISSLGYPISNIDVRVDISVNALLAAIAFQFAIGSEIPDVPYLVFADRLFIITYIIILLTAIINLYIFFNRRGKNAIENKFNGRPILFVSIIGVFIALINFVPLNFNFKSSAKKQEVVVQDSIVSTKDTVVMYGAFIETLSAYNIQTDLFKRGLMHDSAGGKKIPHLIEKIPELTNDLVRFFPDGKALITWRLKKNLQWGDGSPITSQDLLFSIHMVGDANIDSAYITDERTMLVLYKEKNASILDEFDVYPKKYFEEIFKAGGLDSIQAVESIAPPPMDGPFLFDTLVVDSFIRFTRNPYFAGKKPYLSTILIKQLPEGQKPVDVFGRGEGDVMYYLSHKSYTACKQLKGYITGATPSQRFFFLQPDLALPVFQNLKVRQAIAYGLNRKELVSIFDSNYTVGAATYRSKEAPDRLETDSNLFKYDVDYARQLIAESGFKGTSFPVFSYYPDETFNEYKFAAGVVESLKKIGLNARLEKVDKVTPLLESGKHGGLVIVNTGTSSGTFGKFFNVKYLDESQSYDLEHAYQLFDEECIRLCREYKSTLFEERRTIISQALQKIYIETLPTIPMAHFGEKYIIRDNFVGWDYLAANSLWWNVEYWYFSKPGKKQEPEAPQSPL
jgi:ABC-type transport system substrate-binding protein